MLRVENLVKRYDREANQPAGGVFGVSFAVEPGEMFTLLGPSGCGKTTTLRAIAGLEHPDSGVVALDGADVFSAVVNLPVYERDIGMVFQSYAIWPHMSVFENAAYPLRVSRRSRLTRAEIRTKVERMLEMVGLREYGERAATRLSGGQQQRLALARALVREPKLLLLDEPLSNLDAQLREQMRGELKRIQHEWGVTTVYVTHDQVEAMAISDRIAVMNQGLIVQVGAPAEIYELPSSAFVANFIGRTNVFAGRLEHAVAAGASGGGHPPRSARFRCRFAAAAEAGREISFGIRPENVELTPPDISGSENAVEGIVGARVYLGEVAEYTVNLPGGATLLARTRPSAPLATGDRVRVHLPPDRTIAILI